MESNEAPLRGRAAEKERYILTKEDIDKVVRLVMEEGYSMEYAVKMSTGFTPNTFRKKLQVRYPELYEEVKKKSQSNARVNARKPGAGWDKTDYTNFWSLDEWKRRGLIK
jgi:hypothetical protein